MEGASRFRKIVLKINGNASMLVRVSVNESESAGGGSSYMACGGVPHEHFINKAPEPANPQMRGEDGERE